MTVPDSIATDADVNHAFIEWPVDPHTNEGFAKSITMWSHYRVTSVRLRMMPNTATTTCIVGVGNADTRYLENGIEYDNFFYHQDDLVRKKTGRVGEPVDAVWSFPNLPWCPCNYGDTVDKEKPLPTISVYAGWFSPVNKRIYSSGMAGACRLFMEITYEVYGTSKLT